MADAVRDIFVIEIERLQRQWEKYPFLLSALQEDRKNNTISEEEYEIFYEIYEKQYEGLREAVERQKAMLPSLMHSARQAEVRLEYMKQKPGIWEMNRMVLVSFVKRLLVYEDRRVNVELRCREADYEGR